jgi:hypothetical protein
VYPRLKTTAVGYICERSIPGTLMAAQPPSPRPNTEKQCLQLRCETLASGPQLFRHNERVAQKNFLRTGGKKLVQGFSRIIVMEYKTCES